MDDGANDGDERAATSGVGAGALDLRQQIADMSASAIEQIEKLAAMAQLIADAEARAADAEARAADYEARVGRWNELMRQVEAGIARIARMQEAQLSENKRIPGLIESCAAAEARAADAEARAADAEARAADAETRAADAAKRTAQLNQFWKDTLRAQVDETLESWPTAQVDEMLKTSQARTFADIPSEHKLPPAPPRSPLRERND